MCKDIKKSDMNLLFFTLFLLYNSKNRIFAAVDSGRFHIKYLYINVFEHY